MPIFHSNIKSHQNGFTLVELLVAIGVLLLLLGVGIANYLNFNDRQQLVQAAQLVREAFADAQNSARTGKLGGCEALHAYRVSSLAGVGGVRVTARCRTPGGVIDGESRDFVWQGSTTHDSFSPIYISPVQGLFYADENQMDGVELASAPPFEIVLTHDSYTVMVSLSRLGAVTVGEIESL